ncbi:MAG: glutathionylspermidine synthase family protein [Bacteroidota bacterium]|nr:glutathionylspermidine synthase family protein [Bacteroidota bacterium]
MKRYKINPRADWQKKVEEISFGFHSQDNTTYWDESVCYSFGMEEILLIEKATAELWEMCLKAVDYVIDSNLFSKFKIPEFMIPHIKSTWDNDAPAIYGRFDFAYDGTNPPKLLEFNADTPTSLYEAGVVQWYWLQDIDPSKDQFNSIHEKLIAYWEYLKDYIYRDEILYFTTIKDSLEDLTTTEYMRDCASQAGIVTKFIFIDEIGWDSRRLMFVDLDENPIKNIFKLYPYEWMVNEEFGKNLIADVNKSIWIEPSWKMLLSNKAILPVLYDLFPVSPYLLPSYFEKNYLSNYVIKPILSREGANIRIFKNDILIDSTDGEYGEEGFVYQQLAELNNYDNNYPVIGSWVIGQEPAGIGIRESNGLITNNMSRFVPHFIE